MDKKAVLPEEKNYTKETAPWGAIREDYVYKNCSLRALSKKYPGLKFNTIRNKAISDKWNELRITREQDITETVKNVAVEVITDYRISRDEYHQQFAKEILAVAQIALNKIVKGMKPRINRRGQVIDDKYVDHLALSRIMTVAKDAMILERITLGLMTNGTKLDPASDNKQQTKEILNNAEIKKIAKSLGIDIRQLGSLGIGETANSTGKG